MSRANFVGKVYIRLECVMKLVLKNWFMQCNITHLQNIVGVLKRNKVI